MAELTNKIDRVFNIYETWSLNCLYLADVNYNNKELSKHLNNLSNIFFMKSRVIELQEKANQLLELAQDMDRRVESAKWLADINQDFPELSENWKSKADTRRRGSKRLWSAYLQVLTQIKLEL